VTYRQSWWQGEIVRAAVKLVRLVVGGAVIVCVPAIGEELVRSGEELVRSGEETAHASLVANPGAVISLKDPRTGHDLLHGEQRSQARRPHQRGRRCVERGHRHGDKE
jgi:hypothetical protein